MARKKAAPTPVRDAILAQLANPTLDSLWPLPVSFSCSKCHAPSESPGPCKRKNSRGWPLCNGAYLPVTLYRAHCRCMSWTVTEKQLLTRCSACRRRIVAWDPDVLFCWLTAQREAPEQVDCSGAGQRPMASLV